MRHHTLRCILGAFVICITSTKASVVGERKEEAEDILHMRPQRQAGLNEKTGPTTDNLACDQEKCTNGQCAYDWNQRRDVCKCNSGYRKDGNMKCIDIDECGDGKKCDNGKCHNTQGSFSCTCSPGFELDQQRTSCTDVDECTEDRSRCNPGSCQNEGGSYRCLCPVGYKLSYDEKKCEDIDECEAGNECDNGKCHNTQGSFSCTCSPGFKVDLQGTSCTDKDECTDTENPCYPGDCVNTYGGYTCICPDSHQASTDSRSCSNRLGTWTEWGECTVDSGERCGLGYRHRTRTCQEGNDDFCSGKTKEWNMCQFDDTCKAKGEKGDIGPMGSPGQKGDVGDVNKGAKGQKGEKGKPGIKGSKGAKGVVGPTGLKGAKGARGPPSGPAFSNLKDIVLYYSLVAINVLVTALNFYFVYDRIRNARAEEADDTDESSDDETSSATQQNEDFASAEDADKTQEQDAGGSDKEQQKTRHSSDESDFLAAPV